MNTQIATKQFLSFYSNMNNPTSNKKSDIVQNQSTSLNMM